MNRVTELFKDREFIFLDGGLGTMLQRAGYTSEKLPEELNITNPEVIRRIHREYAEAGSDVIYTATFGVNELKTRDSRYTAKEIIEAAVENARAATAGTAVKVALDIGPCGRMLEPNGNLSFEEAYQLFKGQVLWGKGVDLIVIETMTDLYEMKAAALAVKENSDLPVICTMTFEENRRTFTGTSLSSMALTLEGLGVDAIGINCSLGPAEIRPLIEELSKWTSLPIVSKANAGLPDPATGEYSITPEEFAEGAAELIPFGVKLVGGCCGTDPCFIRAVREKFRDKRYVPQNPVIPSAVCTPEKTVVIDGPRVIGERINPTGKKKLKEAFLNDDMDYVLSQAVTQIDDGAEILDVNTGVPGIEEKSVMVKAIKALQGVTDAPLQIDSGDPAVIEPALRIYSGKAIVNSVNGKESSLNAILPLVKKYGAAVVGLTLDEDGIPKTVEKRVEIAKKIRDRALEAGIPERDIYIDCLTLTAAAEQENAAGTLMALRRVKEELGLKTVLGVSNISFGLPQRQIINCNFLQMALNSGLDLPIMNPSSKEMMEAIDVYRVIYNIDKDSAEYIKKYGKEDTKAEKTAEKEGEGDPEKALEYAVINGLKGETRKLTRDILREREPADAINTVLIPILDRVGDRFEKGRIFIPQLMLAATTAQEAFDEVKKAIESSGTAGEENGTIVIATVKGDIHDIGKNIVKVILENYGYDIVDLGKDVAPETVSKAVSEHGAKLLGLSALMTTTLPAMEDTIKLIREVSPSCAIMVGGAVLTPDYAERIGADYYVKDAKESADRAKEVFGK